MNKLAIVAAAALSAAAFGAAAIAQEATPDFISADGNKDNLVSFEEAMGVFPTLTQITFDQVDENKDGSLDEAEFTALIGLSASLATNGGTDQSQPAPSSSMESSESGDASSSSAM